jgi:hypothetical protein
VIKPESFPIEKIFIPEKMRKALNPEMVEEIAESILSIGQQAPIVVRREKDRFVLVEGLHRLEACRALGEPAIIGVVVSAEAARQKALPPQAADPEHEKMERLRKLRLEREAAEKLADAPRTALGIGAAPRPRDHAEKTIRSNKATPKQSGRERAGSTPRTLSDWIKQQERNGGSY